MSAVQHGEAQNVGLIIHNIVHLEQREILQSDKQDEEEIFSFSARLSTNVFLEKGC